MHLDVRARLTGPALVTGLFQVVKSVVAGTLAWVTSVLVLDSELPFLAPWTALLTVHATVYRSLSRGVQTVIASVLGVLLSFAIGATLGVSVGSFALALLAGLLVAQLPWLRDEGVAIATTAIFVLGSDFESQQTLLTDRMLEVALGVGLGAAVNLVIIPPLHNRQASRYVDHINRRMGEVLISIADEFSSSWDTDRAEEWLRETESMTSELDSAWQLVHFARESRRLNPRRRRRRRWVRGGSPHDVVADGAPYERILGRVDEGISHLRHLTRTLREGAQVSGEWDTHFRERWVRIVRDAGHSIADPDASVEPVRERLADLAVTMSRETQLPPSSWPLYGSLIASMEHIAVVVDDVASAREAREHDRENPAEA